MSKEFEKKPLKDEELDKVSGGYMFPPSSMPSHSRGDRTNPVPHGFGPPPITPGKANPC